MAPREIRGLAGLGSLSRDEVVEACELDYIHYWRHAAAASGEWSEEGGIERCVTGLPQEIFNVVLRCRLSSGAVESEIDKAIAEFRTRRIPMIWHVGRTTTPADVGSYLEGLGFPHDYDLIAMAAETTADQPEVGQGITVRECVSAPDIEAWVDCLTRSWNSPAPVGRWMLANPFFAGPRSSFGPRTSRTLHLGLLEGVPSGALMLFEYDGMAGLQCVGTVPEAQRRGVGEMLVRAALREASLKGYSFVVVLATTEGVPLYRKAGFREFGKLPEHSLYFDRSPNEK